MGGKSAAKAAQKEAEQARQDEEARQARITEGTASINSIFDNGGKGDLLTTGATYDPSAVYYNADGTVWSPTSGSTTTAAATTAASTTPTTSTSGTLSKNIRNDGSSGVRNGGAISNAHITNATSGSGNTATGGTTTTTAGKTAAQQFADALASGSIYGSSGGFNDAYYDGIAQSYLDYANPQLVDQHNSANQQLQYDLARGGKLDSSTRATKAADLQEAYDLGQQQIADKAQSYKNDAKNSVEDARASLINQLNTTGDATGATNAAINRMSALSEPAGNYDTLSNLFADFTSTLSSKYAQEQAYAASNGQSSGYTPVSYGASSNAVKVTG